MNGSVDDILARLHKEKKSMSNHDDEQLIDIGDLYQRTIEFDRLVEVIFEPHTDDVYRIYDIKMSPVALAFWYRRWDALPSMMHSTKHLPGLWAYWLDTCRDSQTTCINLPLLVTLSWSIDPYPIPSFVLESIFPTADAFWGAQEHTYHPDVWSRMRFLVGTKKIRSIAARSELHRYLFSPGDDRTPMGIVPRIAMKRFQKMILQH
jgi:hypothetical protein